MEFSEIKTDVLIVGGGTGGTAAALAAGAAGLKVVLTEESDWLGGQFTSQATPPDEHGWIEEFGATRSYRQFRERVRQYYRDHFPLTEWAKNDPFLNPGSGWVSPLCAEPEVFRRVLDASLAPFTMTGNLRILFGHFPVAAETEGNRVRSVTLVDLRSREEIRISAEYFIDATDLGELLPLTGTEFVTGSEGRSETAEPGASETPRKENSQGFSVCFAISHHAGEDHTIERPPDYDFWRNFVPDLHPPWSGRLLSLTGLSPRNLAPVQYDFRPHGESGAAFSGLWTYRRLRDRANFVPGTFASDVTVVNYPQIDYLLADLSNAAGYDRKREIVDDAKRQSLSFLYFLQTGLGFRGLRLRGDVTGTADGLAKMPYVRESRRIRAEFTVLERHVSAACRPGEILAESFPDSVGVGSYRIDLHPTVGGDNYVDVEALPFQIPLGALIPERIENLLPAAKNIGTTHITNGCYRLHPVEWNIGEAAGQLAAFCLRAGLAPKRVRRDAELLGDFQKILVENGFELEWPASLNPADGDPHRFAMKK
ncbi:MAG: FAD-dependent oxidoreductase [Acidobacteria bacterium]|nr:FAD-dependent oxidoreductase [Acidobacteriota bacterium]